MKVHNAEDRISHVYEKIMTLDPGNFDSYDAKLQDELKRASKVNETLYKLIADTRLRPSARRTVPESLSHTRAKPNESLKPFTLTRDATPVQVRQWIDAFRAWYSSSSMDKCTLEAKEAGPNKASRQQENVYVVAPPIILLIAVPEERI